MVFCATSSVFHVIVEDPQSTLLYSVPSVNWGLKHSFMHRSLNTQCTPVRLRPGLWLGRHKNNSFLLQPFCWQFAAVLRMIGLHPHTNLCVNKCAQIHLVWFISFLSCPCWHYMNKFLAVVDHRYENCLCAS